ncbi:hypothetical protein CASFOL_017880 [Castilleja foliolosa]|uniref:Uncharacterized protein n=1 Tax=Castilleja foliolosa TaxID=1961234 RepID=A0ABD3DB99_9LAMI
MRMATDSSDIFLRYEMFLRYFVEGIWLSQQVISESGSSLEQDANLLKSKMVTTLPGFTGDVTESVDFPWWSEPKRCECHITPCSGFVFSGGTTGVGHYCCFARGSCLFAPSSRLIIVFIFLASVYMF